MSKRGYGEKCTYCKRVMESVLSRSRIAATRDHTVPRSKGGKETVWSCRQCNSIKGDMDPDDWAAFMDSFPRWWAEPAFRHLGKAFTPRNGHAAQKHPTNHQLAIVPYHESMMVMRHGKDFWKAWKEGAGEACACCRPAPRGDVHYTAEGWPIVPACR